MYSLPLISVFVRRLHPIVQAKQALGCTAYLRKASPLIFSACSKVFSCQLREGRVPVLCVRSTVIIVPILGKILFFPVRGCSAVFWRQRRSASLKRAASASSTFPSPLTTIALRFFEPMTAPAPPLPWARL